MINLNWRSTLVNAHMDLKIVINFQLDWKNGKYHCTIFFLLVWVGKNICEQIRLETKKKWKWTSNNMTVSLTSRISISKIKHMKNDFGIYMNALPSFRFAWLHFSNYFALVWFWLMIDCLIDHLYSCGYFCCSIARMQIHQMKRKRKQKTTKSQNKFHLCIVLDLCLILGCFHVLAFLPLFFLPHFIKRSVNWNALYWLFVEF